MRPIPLRREPWWERSRAPWFAAIGVALVAGYILGHLW